MNTRLVDLWTLTHITSMFIITSVLLSTGTGIIPILITIIFISSIYELLEHMTLFNFVKEAKEVVANSVLDVVFGLVGMAIAMILMG